ncbi:hypothetical protein C1646_666803 [Rhizophagus diaphanus]|nr:hypothetical protein C1646_666803 [Rhizophagus diaphanus] [Rhizophagus sp. MUCL 43196]
MTMPETKRYEFKEKHVLFRKMRYCIHSDKVKKNKRFELSHPLEINIKFTHNHVIILAELLSFWRVNEKDSFGDRNGSVMFRHLAEVVNDYNNSGKGQAILQEYDSCSGKAFILCVVISLMSRVHEKILQSSEICYMNASASFKPLNTSITLLYISCAVRALPLGLFITSDKLEITLEKALNLLKSILPQHAFYGRGVQLSPKIFLTDNSSVEWNALELCWPESKDSTLIY